MLRIPPCGEIAERGEGHIGRDDERDGLSDFETVGGSAHNLGGRRRRDEDQQCGKISHGPLP
jgi:hypothetical protein